MRATKVLRQLLAPHRDVVVSRFEPPTVDAGSGRPRLVVRVRVPFRRRAHRWRFGAPSPLYDRSGERSWRHVDVGFATSELVCAAPRMSCLPHGPTAAELPFTQHDSACTWVFEDLVVYEAIAS